MPGPEVLIAVVLATVLAVYVLTGGADFGGGVWDLLATGPRAERQRKAIARTIGPIWEANHVWLIVALVITFVAFPTAFAAISTSLHIPLTLLLFGVVLRGSAFVFRAYDSQRDAVQRRYSRVFASASTLSPVLLGVVVGAIASGEVRVEAPDFFTPWLQPFPWAVGGLTLAIFAYLAAVYLTLDTPDDPELQEDFRVRGLGAAGVVFVLAWVSFALARTGAPEVWHGLWARPWSLPLQGLIAAVGLSTIGALYLRRYLWARNLAAAQVVLVIGGWAASQWPWVLPPDVAVTDAAPASVLWSLLIVLAVGALPLGAAYVTLIRVFRPERVSGDA